MTREETKEAIRIMQGYVDKEPIECCVKNSNNWKLVITPSWEFSLLDYRIKPKSHYRPFKNAEEVLEAIKEHGPHGDWVKTKSSGRYVSVKSFDCDYVWFGSSDIGKSFTECYEAVVFADGTPFGKFVEE